MCAVLFQVEYKYILKKDVDRLEGKKEGARIIRSSSYRIGSDAMFAQISFYCLLFMCAVLFQVEYIYTGVDCFDETKERGLEIRCRKTGKK